MVRLRRGLLRRGRREGARLLGVRWDIVLIGRWGRGLGGRRGGGGRGFLGRGRGVGVVLVGLMVGAGVGRLRGVVRVANE